jgi:hypothetical protein
MQKIYFWNDYVKNGNTYNLRNLTKKAMNIFKSTNTNKWFSGKLNLPNTNNAQKEETRKSLLLRANV